MQQPCFPLDTFSHPKNDLFILFVGKKEMCTNVSAALYITVLFVCFFLSCGSYSYSIFLVQQLRAAGRGWERTSDCSESNPYFVCQS